MQSVGMARLKAHLSHYIDRAAAGEPYIITDRGRPVVEIIPLRAEVAAILNMIEEGKATWEGGKPQGFDGPELLGEPLADAVIEDRR
ncbi:MAG: type II toxin-antitoxin system Phd/YefM family antitoxin [Anaerolineae bacterium]|jgi:prevent-host-death family protein